VEAAAADDAVSVMSLSRCAHRPSPIDGVVLGFAAVNEREIRAGIERSARTFDRILRG
jgi:hypothetical protein